MNMLYWCSMRHCTGMYIANTAAQLHFVYTNDMQSAAPLLKHAHCLGKKSRTTHDGASDSHDSQHVTLEDIADTLEQH